MRNWRANKALGFAGAGLGLAVVLSAYAVVSGHYRHTGLMAPDESFYTVAAQAVLEGQRPYVDFAYTQMPVLPYLSALGLELLGSSMAGHRLWSSIWGGVGLLLLALGVWRRTGRLEAGLLAAFILAASPRWTFLQSMGVWCGMTGMLSSAALLAVLWTGNLWPRAAAFAVFGSAAIGCRLSCAPSVAALCLALLIESGSPRRALGVFGLCLAVGGLMIGPLALPDLEAFLYMNWTFHMSSEMSHPWGIRLMQWWDVSPAVIMLFACSLFASARLAWAKAYFELALLLVGVVSLTVPMIPASAWGVYISAGVPLAAAGSMVALYRSGLATRSAHRYAIAALPCLSLLHTLPLEVPEGATREVEEVAAFLRTSVEDGPILTPAGVLAVESGRPLVHGTQMGAFSAMNNQDASRARRYHMTTPSLLEGSVRRAEPAAVVRMIEPEAWRNWNFNHALPAMVPQPVEDATAFEHAIEECYSPAWRTSTMEVLVPRRALPIHWEKP